MYIQTKIKSTGAPKSGEGIRLAVYQVQAGLSGSEEAIDANLETLKNGAKIAKEQYDAQIISFPELFLTGYAFESNEVAYNIAKTSQQMQDLIAPIAKEIGIAIICPYPQKDSVDGEERYYDSMVLIDTNGELLKNYKKTHLWGPDEQSLWSFGYASESEGEAYSVVEVNGFPIALLNCYEAEFAELTRILVTKGAKLVIIPTAADSDSVINGQWTGKTYPDISKSLIPARALENEIFVTYSNYTGTGYIIKDGQKIDQVKYLGNSIIANPHGQTIVSARHDDEAMLIADCIPSDYLPIHPCNTNYIKDRRVALYSDLVKESIAYDDWSYTNPPKPIYKNCDDKDN